MDVVNTDVVGTVVIVVGHGSPIQGAVGGVNMVVAIVSTEVVSTTRPTV